MYPLFITGLGIANTIPKESHRLPMPTICVSYSTLNGRSQFHLTDRHFQKGE